MIDMALARLIHQICSIFLNSTSKTGNLINSSESAGGPSGFWRQERLYGAGRGDLEEQGGSGCLR